MNKSWIKLKDKACTEYIEGTTRFLDFAFQRTSKGDKIVCPCERCVLSYWHSRQEVFEHVTNFGFLRGYTRWTVHGEDSSSTQSVTTTVEEELHGRHDIDTLLQDTFRIHSTDEVEAQEQNQHDFEGPYNQHARNQFHELLKDAEQVLYPSCKSHTKLSCVVHLYHLKCLNGWSNKSFGMLLEFLKGVLPEGNVLPKSFYEAKTLISGLGLGYEKIHACPNNCMLFWKDNSNIEVCNKCGASRWKAGIEQQGEGLQNIASVKRKTPAKILRWFPLIPRLQRLFMCSKTAVDMTWHEHGRENDGKMRHPADSLAWKHFSSKYPDFSSEPRNIRLGLATDGFNPFRTMNVTHSTWPVVLIPYNLPPWLCLKQPNLILSLLVDGPKSPGDKLDVYMQPLIEELLKLWEVGVQTFDASEKETFTLRAILLWTISDFPAYANISGWSTKGEYACPICQRYTRSKWLDYGRKFCYMCHRRWLDDRHPFRYDKRSFDGERELRSSPIPLSGIEIVKELDKIDNGESAAHYRQWKKRSILFSLPYWEHHLIRHNLDLMHIEKNVCDNIIWTILGDKKKSKDNYKARLDLQKMGLRSELHPKKRDRSSNTYLPKACYQMTSKEKDLFLKVLHGIKAPDEFSSNISRCVQLSQRKLIGLKSHDCHILIQEFFPIAICGSIPENVSKVLIELSNFFKGIWSKVLTVEELEQMQSTVAQTICKLERIFPPSFFTVMVHLVIHLAPEAKLGGPAPYRSMYWMERNLGVLKSQVRNRTHPEASIAEGYVANECLTFCSRYMSGVETRFNRPSRNDEDENLYDKDVDLYTPGRALGRRGASGFNVKKRRRVFREELDEQTLMQAHRYVLYNSGEIGPFLKEHETILKRQARPRRLSQYEIQKIQSRDFPSWFKEHVMRLDAKGSTQITDQIRNLARGPQPHVRKYTGYIIKGCRFHTKSRERNLKTQNSGVMVTADTNSYATTRDMRPVAGKVAYYGQLTDIIQLNYHGSYKIILFRCDWVDINRGIKKDKFGFTVVNFSYLGHQGANFLDDPFVYATDAIKVYYVGHPFLKDWLVVKTVHVRDVYDMGDEQSNNSAQLIEDFGMRDNTSDASTDAFPLARSDVPVEEVDEVTLEEELNLNKDISSESEEEVEIL